MKPLEGISGKTVVGRSRQLARTGALWLAVAAGLGAASCQSPTQMRMVLRTDLPCGTPTGTAPYAVNDLSIFVASNDASLRERIQAGTPSAYLSACTPGAGGELGTLYLTPDGTDQGMVAVMAGLVHATAAGTMRQSAQACTSASQENCLLSIRRFRYSAHQTGVVPVLLEASCVNHRPECAPGQTCRAGACASDMVDGNAADPFDAGRVDGAVGDAQPPVVDAGPPSVFRCESTSVVWTPDPPLDPSCASPDNTLRCLTQTKEGLRAICTLLSDPSCQTPCCNNRLPAQRTCCIVDGVPVSRRNLGGCGTDPTPCFDKAECDNCSGTFDEAKGFGACK